MQIEVEIKIEIKIDHRQNQLHGQQQHTQLIKRTRVILNFMYTYTHTGLSLR